MQVSLVPYYVLTVAKTEVWQARVAFRGVSEVGLPLCNGMDHGRGDVPIRPFPFRPMSHCPVPVRLDGNSECHFALICQWLHDAEPECTFTI